MASTLVPNNTIIVLGFGAPTDATFSTPPADGQQYCDEATGLTYIRIKGVWTQNPLTRSLMESGAGPATGLGASVARNAGPWTDNTTGLVSATARMDAIFLPAGITVTNLNLLIGATTAVAPLNQWQALCDSSRKVLAVTADATSAVPTGSVPLVTALTAPFVTTYSGLYYICTGWKVTTTLPSILTMTSNAIATAIPPILCGTSSTAQTGPPVVGSTMGAITAGAFIAYVYAT